MSIRLNISPRIIPSVASLYTDVNRIFMEYIDNSLDSAETYYDRRLNIYSKSVEIKLKIRGDSYKDGKVIISDNCTGISNFTKVVESVGNSDKKVQPWTNGQFGYGIYSFLAACDTMQIISKIREESHTLSMSIYKEQFDKDKQEEVLFPDPKITNYDYDSGSTIILSRFNKSTWHQIDIENLKKEIEKHFELLLKRGNLQIRLIDQEGKIYLCRPFNYEIFEGEYYEDDLKELTYVKGRRFQEKIRTTINPIKVFIKVIKGKVINKNPVFIAKGRRIAEIKDVSSFRSKHKSDIWDHPNVTGYVDVSDFLEPTIARNDFVNSDDKKALFNTLYELEPLILDVIKDVNKSLDERHYKELEDQLNQVLSKLARIDSMNYRTVLLTGNEVNLKKGGSGQSIQENQEGGKDRVGEKNNHGKNGGAGENEGKNKGIGDDSGNIPGGNVGDKASSEEATNPFEDTGFKGGEKKKSGFNIRISNNEPFIDISFNKPLRSQLAGNEIIIFRKHPDFEKRVHESRKGEKFITERLITYLAGEITVHYKDKFHMKSGQPTYNKQLFIDLVEFIYNFEQLLSGLVGKNLADFNK